MSGLVGNENRVWVEQLFTALLGPISLLPEHGMIKDTLHDVVDLTKATLVWKMNQFSDQNEICYLIWEFIANLTTFYRVMNSIRTIALGTGRDPMELFNAILRSESAEDAIRALWPRYKQPICRSQWCDDKILDVIHFLAITFRHASDVRPYIEQQLGEMCQGNRVSRNKPYAAAMVNAFRWLQRYPNNAKMAEGVAAYMLIEWADFWGHDVFPFDKDYDLPIITHKDAHPQAQEDAKLKLWDALEPHFDGRHREVFEPMLWASTSQIVVIPTKYLIY